MLSCLFTSCLTKAKAERTQNIFIMDFFLVVFLVVPQVCFLQTNTYIISVYFPLPFLLMWLWRLGQCKASNVFKDFISFSFHRYMRDRICLFFFKLVCYSEWLAKCRAWMSLQRLYVARDLVFTITVPHGAATSRWVSAITRQKTGSTRYPRYIGSLQVLEW